MLYPVFCRVHGEMELDVSIHKFYDGFPCPTCSTPTRKIYESPVFTEDRLRFAQGALGDGWSQSMGAPMPQSRSQRKALERLRGAEFVGPNEDVNEYGRAARLYQEAKAQGCSDQEADAASPLPQPKPVKPLAAYAVEWAERKQKADAITISPVKSNGD
jgi:hypothetical protein